MNRRTAILFSFALFIILILKLTANGQENTLISQKEPCKAPLIENIGITKIEPSVTNLGGTLTLTLGTIRDTDSQAANPESTPLSSSTESESSSNARNESKKIQSILDENKYILFLDNYALNGVYGQSLAQQQLVFDLERNQLSKKSWNKVLGSSIFIQEDIQVSFGCPNQSPIALKGEQALSIIKFPLVRTVIFILLTVLSLIVFFYFRLDLIRDITPPIPFQLRKALKTNYNYKPPVSLARSQMALWFFIIFLSYGYIFVVSGEFTGILNEQSIILMGITSGTGILGFTIDQNRIGNDSNSINEIVRNRDLDIDFKAQKLNQHLPSTHGSSISDFLRDILSDKNGVSIYRYQIFAWTIFLAFIFIYEVQDNLAFPVFDTTLLALQGISSGTYLGFKLREPPKDAIPPNSPPALSRSPQGTDGTGLI